MYNICAYMYTHVLYVYMYVCTYVCTYRCVYIRMHMCSYVCMCTLFEVKDTCGTLWVI